MHSFVLYTMGRRKDPNRKVLRTVLVSEMAHEFIINYGGKLYKEPFHRRIDRFIDECRRRAELAEKSNKQGMIIEYYHGRIKELESQIEELQGPKQTQLVP